MPSPSSSSSSPPLPSPSDLDLLLLGTCAFGRSFSSALAAQQQPQPDAPEPSPGPSPEDLAAALKDLLVAIAGSLAAGIAAGGAAAAAGEGGLRVLPGSLLNFSAVLLNELVAWLALGVQVRLAPISCTLFLTHTFSLFLTHILSFRRSKREGGERESKTHALARPCLQPPSRLCPVPPHPFFALQVWTKASKAAAKKAKAGPVAKDQLQALSDAVAQVKAAVSEASQVGPEVSVSPPVSASVP
jgi:hypothetical protein